MPKHQTRKHYSSSEPLIIMEGGYIVLEKSKFSGAVIASPGIQTCVMLVIQSPLGIAAAHIDNSFSAKKATKTLIDGLKQLGSKTDEMHARLIGGDVGNPITGSQCIYQPIVNELKRQKIKHTYDDYSWDFSLIASGTYFALQMFNLAGPTSYFWSILAGAALYAVGKLHAYLIENNFDLHINVDDGTVNLIKNDPSHTKSLFKKASTHNQFSLFKARMHLDKRNPNNSTALELIKVIP